MQKPLVALVGRPNVGKSTLFNKLVGKRISIVDDMPGVTRDRLYADVEWCGHVFTLIDTGGIELKSEDVMWKHILNQANLAVEVADVIVFVLDGKAGMSSADYDVAKFLRTAGKPIVLCINKIDNPRSMDVYDFYNLGLGEPFAVSAEQSLGVGDMLDAVVENFDRIEAQPEEEGLKIAIVGKPNAGKSSILNRLLGYERNIVSDIAGTTRDAIDTPFDYNGKRYTLIDTAGVRRKRSVDEAVEQYSVMRSLYAVRRADVVLVVIDSEEMLTEQDVRLAGYVHEQGKPSVIIMNKWDLIEKDTGTINTFKKKIETELKFMDYFAPLFVSAKSGQRINKIMDEAIRVYDNASRRVTTGLLNDVIMDAVRMNEPPSYKGRRLKIMYGTQVSSNPPTFVLFVNDPTLIHFSYKRYLENAIRKAFDYSGTPIRIAFRNKEENK